MFSLAVGREEHCKQYHWHLWGVLAVSWPHWVCPRSWRVCFPCLHCLGSRLLCWELRPALGCVHFQGLSRSGSGTQVLLKGTDQVQAAQVTRCLASVVAETYHLPRPCRSVFWVCNQRTFSGVPCVSSGELISGCDPPSRCRPSRIPRSLG